MCMIEQGGAPLIWSRSAQTAPAERVALSVTNSGGANTRHAAGAHNLSIRHGGRFLPGPGPGRRGDRANRFASSVPYGITSFQNRPQGALRPALRAR